MSGKDEWADDWETGNKRYGYYEDDVDEAPAPPVAARSERAAPAAKPSPAAAPARPVSAEPEPADDADERLVRRATRILADLVAQSQGFAGLDWAVGAFTELSGKGVCYATSNEGFGFLPWGLRWPPDAKPVFGLGATEWDTPWQGLANPARIVADHFAQGQMSARSGLKLATIVSSAPLGQAVADLLAEQGAVFAQISPTGSDGRGQGQSRLDTVGNDLVALARAVPPERRWATGVYLMQHAVEFSQIGEAYPSALQIVRGAWDGNVTADDWERVQYASRQLDYRAQMERVGDEYLGPVRAAKDWQEREDLDVCPPEHGLMYIQPFQRARACAMLERLVAGWVRGSDLGAEDVAEMAYEHYCVVEDAEATAGVLRGQI
ncbi:MAG: hypothetical protein ACRC20_08820 [Segniliparus sp.]|uniref:hypothetical protein n=1 Tax=Segniliparus sp. TaxID=2804064 RepID=UPI003F367683